MVLVQQVSKIYRLYRRPSERVLGLLPLWPQKLHTDFWALRDVSFSADRGEAVGIIGPNGSGKSTLLQVISGIVQPTSGRVCTEGRIAAVLELGAGFNPEFTGRENVRLSGEIMGLSRREVERALPSIARFAEIGDFMERPVKEYSSGMYVRLAFATAIHVEPEILVVDEALAVGDAIFANRCVRKFQELRDRNVTILFVSHDLGLVKQLADRALLMLNGRVEAVGNPSDVTNRYVGLVLERQRLDLHATPDRPAGQRGTFRHGDGTSHVTAITLQNQRGEQTKSLMAGERATITVTASFQRKATDPVVGILIRNRLGADVFGTNTRIEGIDLGTYAAGDELEVDFSFDCLLTRQAYTLTVATQHSDGSSQDWLDDVLEFTVVDPRNRAGVASFETSIAWRRRVDPWNK